MTIGEGGITCIKLQNEHKKDIYRIFINHRIKRII